MAVSAKLGMKGEQQGGCSARRGICRRPRAAAGEVGPPPGPTGSCDLFLAFVRSARDLGAHVVALPRYRRTPAAVDGWPKKASGVKSDLDGNVVRATGSPPAGSTTRSARWTPLVGAGVQAPIAQIARDSADTRPLGQPNPTRSCIVLNPAENQPGGRRIVDNTNFFV